MGPQASSTEIKNQKSQTDPRGVHLNQLPSSTSGTLGSSVTVQGLTKHPQHQQMHLPSSSFPMYSTSGSEAIDIHHVIVNGSRATGYTRRKGLGFFLVLLASCMYFLLEKDNPFRILSWSCLISGLLVMLQSRKFVKKESVIIMPTLGVQLETQYRSGKAVSRFIPMGKILKPVLVECCTPITCYSSLSLLLRGEEQLTLVFKELRPPLNMLTPIWEALCAVMDTDQRPVINEEEPG